jgi:hypothetical protein
MLLIRCKKTSPDTFRAGAKIARNEEWRRSDGYFPSAPTILGIVMPYSNVTREQISAEINGLAAQIHSCVTGRAMEPQEVRRLGESVLAGYADADDREHLAALPIVQVTNFSVAFVPHPAMTASVVAELLQQQAERGRPNMAVLVLPTGEDVRDFSDFVEPLLRFGVTMSESGSEDASIEADRIANAFLERKRMRASVR